MPKKIIKPLSEGMASKICFHLYLEPQILYSLGKKIYHVEKGVPRMDKIYKVANKLSKEGYLFSKPKDPASPRVKIFDFYHPTLIEQIVRDQTFYQRGEPFTDLEKMMLTKLLGSMKFKGMLKDYVDLDSAMKIDFLDTICTILAYSANVWFEIHDWVPYITDMYERTGKKQEKSLGEYFGELFDKAEENDMKIESIYDDVVDIGALPDIIESTIDLENLSQNRIIDQMKLSQEESRTLKLTVAIILFAGLLLLPEALLVKLARLAEPTKLQPYKNAIIMMHDAIIRSLELD